MRRLFTLSALCFTLLFAVEAQRSRNSFRRLNRIVTGGNRSCNRSSGAQNGDIVTIHYTGKLASDGKQFDSSVGKDPISFELGIGRVIPGWDQGLLGTCEGQSLKLEIPSNLAYGEAGAGGVIPPNADLVFDLTLEKLEKGRKITTTTTTTTTTTRRPPSRASSRKEEEVEIIEIAVTECSKKEKSRDRDVVTFDYVGKLPDGSTFSSSQESGPITIEIGKTGLKGWDIGLSGACPGDRRKIIIPPSLAYGEKGVENLVPPNTPITIELTLHNVRDRVLNFLDRFSSGTFQG